MNRAHASGYIAVGVGLSLLSALLSNAYSGEIRGVIRFTGSIVEGSCNVRQDQSHLVTRCVRSDQTYADRRDLRQLPDRTELMAASYGYSELNWLNSDHTQGLVTVSYY